MFNKESGSGIPGLSRSGQFHAVAASFLGWTLDAFDFFVVVFLINHLAIQFHVSKADIIASLFVTLIMRPVGAIIFGLMTDRYGRRIPLMTNVVFFSVVELACGFSPNLTFFLIMRALYGIGMGGEWGIGASLAMESVPPRWRGILSGFLQSGYSTGYILAAIVARFVLPVWGWRWMFWLGGVPALLAFYISARVPESEAWKQHRAPSTGAVLKIVARQWKSFLYLMLLMTFMMFLSHGTQDLYPDFLGTVHKLGSAMQSYMAIIYNIGAIVGAIVFGQFSDKFGRRFAMIAALCLSLLVIPFWAFGTSLLVLAVGSFLMQAGVQGAWGVIPVHLNELSADETRGLVPGLAYQLGIVIAAPTNSFEFALRGHVGYQWALAGFEIVTIAVLIVTIALGKERKGRSFHKEEILAPS
ncbi:MAG: MFS transporter [Candidatus Acidiferrales bacterium]